jgi:hypothetical protein
MFLNRDVSAVYGGIGNWNGTNPTSALYQSGQVASSSGGAFTFSPGLTVTAGTEYVAFLSVYGISSTGETSMPGCIFLSCTTKFGRVCFSGRPCRGSVFSTMVRLLYSPLIRD